MQQSEQRKEDRKQRERESKERLLREERRNEKYAQSMIWYHMIYIFCDMYSAIKYDNTVYVHHIYHIILCIIWREYIFNRSR